MQSNLMPPTFLYPEPPEELKSPYSLKILRYLGPGFIIASVTVGSGELVWASRSGAIFGYGLLWCFLYAGVFKAIQVYTGARYLILTGEHPMVAWRFLPGPPLWFPLLIAVPAVILMPIAFSTIPEILGTFIHRLSGLPSEGAAIGAWEYNEWWNNLWATCTVTTCLLLALISRYTLLERVSTIVLGIMVVCILISVVVYSPDLLKLLYGLFVPTLPEYQPWVLEIPRYNEEFTDRNRWLELSIYLTAVGGGAYDYIGYVGMLREKGWGLAGQEANIFRQSDVMTSGPNVQVEIQRARIWTVAPLLDIIISFGFVILITILFAVLGTLILHPEHAIPSGSEMLTVQESFLSKLHPPLKWVYRLGVFLAFIGTIYGAFEVYRYTFMESLKAIAPKSLTPENSRRWGNSLVAYCFLGGLLLTWLPQSIAGNIIDRVTFSSVISGATSCGLWCFAMLWVDGKRLPVSLRMRTPMRVLVVIAGTIMTLLGLQTIVAYLT